VAGLIALLACAGPTLQPEPVAVPAPQELSTPAPSSPLEPERFVFGSCFDPSKPAPITRHVASFEPDLLVLAGDNTYGSGVHLDPSMPTLARAYAALEQHPDWQRLQALGVPIHATWDDHDYGSGDGGADFALKAQAREQFLDFWGVPPEDARRSREGVYQSWSWGPPGERVELVLLDTRTHRSPLKPTDERGAPGKERYVPDPDPAKTMLGPDQWTWLEATLREPADLRFVVSSIQVLSTSHGWEAWNNLPLERRRLLDLIGPGTILVSGDRHTGQIYRDGELVELTASSWTSPAPSEPEADPLRVGAPVRTTNFGVAVVDWSTRQVALTVVGEDGRPQVVEVVTLP
jgi:alkaline phosphatase D